MRGAAALASIPLLLCACSPRAAPPAKPQAVALDCSQGFQALAAAIAAVPGVQQAPKDPGDPYRWYNTADQATSYVVTESGAPAHPAIVMERAAGGAETLSGCSWGDKAGYRQLLAYVKSLHGPGAAR